MGKLEFHVEKARRNEDFFNSYGLSKSQYNEWGVTVLFYAAMHLIDAVLSQDNSVPGNVRNPKDHITRNWGVGQSTSLNAIYTQYFNLYERSREARYGIISFPDGFLNKLESTNYASVKSHVKAILGLK
ncbi:MAG: hypothetical protein A2Z28_05255 [Chloroflexi bacterium RBG_16_51_9]|nr:MAG: hypothetical protein A2Z28_05255 [Chloroflexi bacterium RBG_16_51_9]